MRLQLVDDKRTFNILYQSIQSASIIGIDTEFTNLDVHQSRLLLVSMYLNDTRFVLDMTKLDRALFMRLQPYLEDETILKVGHNLTVEWKQFYKYGKIMMTGMHDTMIAEQMILAGLNAKFDLKSVAKRRLNRDMDKAVRNEFIDLPEDATFTAEQIEYSGDDAVIPVEIYHQQIQEIHQKELDRIYDLEMHIIAPTAMMEYTGVPINRDTLMAMVEPFERYIKTSEKAFQDLIIEYGSRYCQHYNALVLQSIV
jgi:DNA polymerase I-like protein with 3'-5' exonuclease and polymerase domains